MLQTIMQFVTCYDSYPIKKGSSTLFWMPLPHIHFYYCPLNHNPHCPTS